MTSVRPVVLFGYDSSAFTQKVRLVLKLKQIPYKFVIVPSMMPRPVLKDNFNLTYRKIPVCAIGREVYCDTSLIIETLEHIFSKDYRSIYPPATDGRTNRTLIRGFASLWTDRPFFRVTTGLIPSSVWRTHFGTDRGGLIGHKLDPNKLEAKVPQNLSNLDLHLSILEPQFTRSSNDTSPWIFSTPYPSLADISLFYQLDWGNDIASGRGINNLTAGRAADTNTEGASSVFNANRYPNLYAWFEKMKAYFAELPSTETRVDDASKVEEVMKQLQDYEAAQSESLLVPTPSRPHYGLDRRIGLVPGVKASIAPDDTGRDDPTFGMLVDLSPEEVVIKPLELEAPAKVDVQVHFPRLGFVVQPVKQAKL